MAERLINVDRETPMLLPPDLRDWVADNELARLILEAVELCDLQGASRNVRGSGSEQYPPTMMLALLIYCYASGTFSSRRIERATYDSIAVRYVCGNHHPDHDTIAHFRRHNGALFARCFATVVQLAREAGLLKLAAISIDGTRLAGAASKRRVRTLAQIEAELQELESQGGALLAQAEAADRSDLDAGGTQLPPELANAQVRRGKVGAAKADIQERGHTALQAGGAERPDKARRTPPGRLRGPGRATVGTARRGRSLRCGGRWKRGWPTPRCRSFTGGVPSPLNRSSPASRGIWALPDCVAGATAPRAPNGPWSASRTTSACSPASCRAS